MKIYKPQEPAQQAVLYQYSPLVANRDTVALRRLKGMQFQQHWPDAVTKAVFSLELDLPGAPSAAHMRVCQNEEVRS